MDESIYVGGPPPQNQDVVIADYDPIWPHWYESAAFRIREALGDKVLQLDHVGSTSVRGLPAKPLIDIDMVVADTTDEGAYVPPLEAIGYTLRIREPDWFEHRLLLWLRPARQPPRLQSRLRGDRAHAALPRLAAHAPPRSRPLPAHEARARREAVEVRPGLRRREERGDPGDLEPGGLRVYH
jgi:GrpB-like predicted nucleotidyltransferase (UPF0157 family)